MSVLQKTSAAVPLFFAACGITVGVLSYWYITSYSIAVLSFFLCIFFLFFLYRYGVNWRYEQKLYSIFLPILLMFFGFFVAYRQNNEFCQLRCLFSTKKMSVQGVVRDIEKTKNPIFPYEVTICVFNYAVASEEYVACSATIKVMTRRYGSLSVGDTIELSITTSGEIDKSTSFAYFLMKENLASYLFIPMMQAIRLDRPIYSFARFLYRKRAALYEAIRQTCSEKTMIFFKMLFLGKKGHGDEINKIANYFQYWGIVHMTARSGLHMTLFGSLCTMILQLFPLPFIIKNILLLIIFLVYALFSYPSVSFVRAFATSIGILLFHCITKRSDFLHITLIVYIVQLLINPIVLFFLDFQLSFLLTIGIGFFFKKYFYKLLI